MAIIQISRIQVRRGLKEDLPQLASAEFGWAIDTRQLYIGNGTSEEGAPTLGNTEILTQFSDIFSLSGVYTYKGREAGYTVQTGASTLSAITRAMQDKFDDMANIKDFGAVGDGIMRDSSGEGEGDGLWEVNAFNRAITELHKTEVLGTNTRARRTIYIPAGTYYLFGDFIRLMPYVKLKGDGKNATFLVQGSSLQPCVLSSCDSALHTGFAYSFPESPSEIRDSDVGAGIPPAILPGYAEVEDLTLVNLNDRDVAYLHTVNDTIFTRVGFVGPDQLVPVGIGSEPLPSTCVRLASSQFSNAKSKSLTFNECEFSGKIYGFYADSKVDDVNFSGCKFDRLFRGLNLGQSNDGSPMPRSIKVAGSLFDNIAAEGIYAETSLNDGVQHVVSAYNTYKNVGQTQGASSTTAVINFGGDNCYSIGDLFDRSYYDTIPSVNLNGKASYALLNNSRYQLGKQIVVGGYDIALADATLAAVDVGIIGVGANSTTVEYSITRNSEQRTGILKVSSVGSTIAYDDEYVETSDIGVEIMPVINSGVISLTYTMAASGSVTPVDAILKISTKTLI